MGIAEVKTRYVVQESWKDSPWIDHHTFQSLEEAGKMLTNRQSDPIWFGEGRRKWRLVERTINDQVLPSAPGKLPIDCPDPYVG